MTVLETTRCLVRRMVPADADALLAVYGDAETVRFVGDRVPLDIDQCRRWVEVTEANYAARGYGMFAVDDRADGGTVGFCGIVHPGGQPTPEIKYAFRRDRWGRGLAREVVPALLAHGFGSLRLRRIIATVDPRNTASIRVLLGAGMTEAGTVTHDDGTRTTTYEAAAEPALP